MNSLLGIHLRFRIGRIAMTSDVSDMFCRVYTLPKDTDCLRFLFNEKFDDEPKTYAMQTHVFGAKCSPTCAMYALRRCALDNAHCFSSLSVETFLRDFYVDDFMHSTDSVNQAVQLSKDVIEVAASGGFVLTKWVSNSRDVLKVAENTDGVVAEVDLDLHDEPVSRVLGVRWKVKDDVFYFKVSDKVSSLPGTKRGILSLVSSIFDPMGFLSPFIIRARMFIQSLWSSTLGWDDALYPDLLKCWNSWLSELSELDQISIDRKYWPSDFQPVSISLHCFGDSSERAFAACCYIRSVNSSGQIHVSLFMARTRVAPVGKGTLTLPRLELQAAVLCARLVCDIIKELESRVLVEDVTYWSDSLTVLRYLSNDEKRFKTFVANRVAEVRSCSKPCQWRYCQSEVNPADLATRGQTLSQFLSGK